MSVKIKNTNWIKIGLDIVMALIVILMYNKRVISMEFHEIGGLFVCGLFVIHKLLNFKWIATVSAKLFGKDLPIKTRLGYMIDVLLLIAFSLIAISGILISKTFFHLEAAGGSWKMIHYSASAAALTLVGLHIGLNWSFIMGMFKKGIRIPASVSKPLCIALVAIIVVYGGYSVATSSFTQWISMPFSSVSSGGHVGAPTQNGQGKIDAVKGSSPGTGGTKLAPSGEGRASGGQQGLQNGFSAFALVNVLATFSSIIGLFGAVTYYVEKMLKSKKRPAMK